MKIIDEREMQKQKTKEKETQKRQKRTSMDRSYSARVRAK